MPRQIVEPKYIDTHFFEEQELPIIQTLRDVQLLGFAELQCPFVAHMIRGFFQNLTFSSDPSLLTTTIKGVDISVTAADWDALIGYRGLGNAAFDGSDYHGFEQYDRETFAASVVRQGIPLPVLPKFSSTHLSMHHRLLHYLISHTIIPRAGNHGIVLNTDLFVMWAILRREPIFWPDTFCRIMMAAKRSKSAKLPFPMLIQRIMELKGVPMQDEIFFTLKGNHRFGSTILKKSGFHQVAGEWRWDEPARAAHADAAEDAQVDAQDAGPADASIPMDEDAQPDAAHTIDPPPSASATSMADILSALTSMQTSVTQGFERMDARFERVDAHLTEQRTYIKAIDVAALTHLRKLHGDLADIGGRLDDIERSLGIPRDRTASPPPSTSGASLTRLPPPPPPQS